MDGWWQGWGVVGAHSAESLAAVVREHGGVITWSEAAKAGLSRHAVQWALQTKLLHSVRRGVYTTTAGWLQASPEVRHGLQVLAQQRVSPRLAACETSAAIALALPTPSGPPPEPQLTLARPPMPLRRGIRGARGRRGGSVIRRSLLGTDEVWTLGNGIKATSPVRTVLDCSRVWDRPWGLALADAVLAKWPVEPAELVAAATARAPAQGRAHALWVAEHARPKVESPLESLARAVIVLAGLPEPRPQVWLRTRDGNCRVDLLDEANNVITEADGKVKYSVPQDVWEEKRREDALRDRGFEVVRFTHADYCRPDPWLAGYRRALARGSARGPLSTLSAGESGERS